MDICLSAARAAASRRNGAMSRGPNTPEGKARSARNALKHGLRAEKFVVLPDEDAEAFEAVAQALMDDLAPMGALQEVLARRLVVAAWRLERADRIESELFALQAERSERGWGRLGLALVRDGNGPRAFDTVLRYRGSAMAELWRALRALKALQAQATADHEREDAPEAPDEVGDAPDPQSLPQADAAESEAMPVLAPSARCDQPIEPEALGNPGEIAPVPPADEPPALLGLPGPTSHAPSPHACERARKASQKCATMRHLCAIDAPPSTDGALVRGVSINRLEGAPGLDVLGSRAALAVQDVRGIVQPTAGAAGITPGTRETGNATDD